MSETLFSSQGQNIDALIQKDTIREILAEAEKKLTAIIGKAVLINSYRIFETKVVAPPITIEEIKTEVCLISEVPRELLESKSRKIEFVFARYIAIVIVDQYFPQLSLKSLGKVFGGRDHSTIINAKNKHQDLMNTNFRSYPTLYKQCSDRVHNLILSKINKQTI